MNTHARSLANAGRNLALLSLLAAPCAAQQIIQPVAVSTTLSGTNSTQELLIDQSGLSSAYISGETDFEIYMSQTLHANTGQMTRPFTPGRTITFDLGIARRIDAIGLWGGFDTQFQLTQFTLFADDDSDFGNGATALGTFNQALTSDGSAFSFAGVASRFVHVLMTANAGGNQIRIGEVAFRMNCVEEIPAPTLPTTRVDFDDLPQGSTNLAAINAAGRSGDANITGIFPTFPSSPPTAIYNVNTGFGRALSIDFPFGFEVIGNGGSAPFPVVSSLLVSFEQPMIQIGFRVADTAGSMKLEFFEGSTRTATHIAPPFTASSGLAFAKYQSPFGSEGFDRVRISRNGNGNWVLTELEVQIPFEEIGVGCVGSGGQLSLTPQTAPLLGTSYELQLSNAAPQAPFGIAIMLLNLAQLPGSGLDLTPFGAPTCSLRIEGAVTTAFQTAGGSGTFAFAVPNNASLVGADLFAQAADLDAAANALGITVSNAVGFAIR